MKTFALLSLISILAACSPMGSTSLKSQYRQKPLTEPAPRTEAAATEEEVKSVSTFFIDAEGFEGIEQEVGKIGELIVYESPALDALKETKELAVKMNFKKKKDFQIFFVGKDKDVIDRLVDLVEVQIRRKGNSYAFSFRVKDAGDTGLGEDPITAEAIEKIAIQAL